MTPPSELNTIGKLRPFKVSSRSRNRRSTCGPSNLPSAAIHSLQPGPQALAVPLATKKIIGSGSVCAAAPCGPKVKASAAAVPAKTKRTVLMAILLAPARAATDRHALGVALPKNDHRQCPLLRAGGERPRPDGAADEGDELAPSRAFNPWTDPGREWTIAAPNAETTLRFAVMEGDVLHHNRAREWPAGIAALRLLRAVRGTQVPCLSRSPGPILRRKARRAFRVSPDLCQSPRGGFSSSTGRGDKRNAFPCPAMGALFIGSGSYLAFNFRLSCRGDSTGSSRPDVGPAIDC